MAAAVCSNKENAPPAAATPSVAVGCAATLSVDEIGKLRDEDVTVEMLLAYATRLHAAEEKIRELSSSAAKRKAADVLGQPTSKAAKGAETAKDVTAKRRDMIVKKVHIQYPRDTHVMLIAS